MPLAAVYRDQMIALLMKILAKKSKMVSDISDIFQPIQEISSFDVLMESRALCKEACDWLIKVTLDDSQ